MATSKIALVTGANKGIGFEVAKQLSEKSYKVFLACRSIDRGTQAIQALKEQEYENIQFLPLDVTKDESIKNASQQLQDEGLVLDVLVNNAGISGGWPQPAPTMPIDDIKTVFETNFFGLINVTQQFIPLMMNAEAPRIVNVSSSLGSSLKNADPMWKYGADKLTAYCASKTALNSYTITLAHELRQSNFKVNSVNPGYTSTDLNGHTGELEPSAAAEVIVKYACLDGDGPTGGFFEAEGMLPW